MRRRQIQNMILLSLGILAAGFAGIYYLQVTGHLHVANAIDWDKPVTKGDLYFVFFMWLIFKENK